MSKRVLLYGRSAILGSVGASLRRYPSLEVVTLSPPLPDTLGLSALAPDVILYDVEAARPEAALSLLDNCPRLLLMGISACTNRVLVWSGSDLSAQAAQDLMDVIEARDGPAGS